MKVNEAKLFNSVPEDCAPSFSQSFIWATFTICQTHRICKPSSVRCLGGLRMKYLRLEAPAQACCGSVGRSRLSVLKETRRFTGAWQERFRLRGRRKDLFGDTRGYKSYDSNCRKCCMLLHTLSLTVKDSYPVQLQLPRQAYPQAIPCATPKAVSYIHCQHQRCLLDSP